MKIIKQKEESYASRKIRELKPHALIILGWLVVVLSVILLTLFVASLQKYLWIAIVLGIASFFISKEQLDSVVKEIENFRYGEEGEKAILKTLRDTMDSSYAYIPNYTIPNTKIGDVDGLLIGPKGIVILEIKNWSGVFRISGSDVYRRIKRDIFKLYCKSPFKQIVQQEKYLEKFLNEKGIDVRTVPVIVFTERGKIYAFSGQTGVYITEQNKLANHLFKLPPIPDWSVEFSNKIIAALGLENQNNSSSSANGRY